MISTPKAIDGRYDAVLFDLLSALIDSWSLWDDLAGNVELGRKWRMHYLNATGQADGYVPYLSIVSDSAKAVGLPGSLASELGERWGELTPWPEAPALINKLASSTNVGIVTNCSEDLGQMGASRLGTLFNMFLTAERAGCYKPKSSIYQQAIAEIGSTPDRILYVAGSPIDVHGAAAVGMPVYWHNRIGIVDPEASSLAIETSSTLDGVINHLR